MSTETAPVKLPTATWDALREVVIAAKGSSQIAGIKSESEWTACAHAIAAPLIATELRRLADQLIGEEDAHKLWRAISRRADKLDPPA